MAFNRLFTVLGATGLGLTVATSAMAGPTVYLPPDIGGVGVSASDTGLGFGKFLGTWKNQSPFNDDINATMPNPSGNTLNVEEVGLAILAQHPGLFPIAEFNLAGLIDPFGDDANNLNAPGVGFRVEDKLDAYTAKWTYSGFPVDPPGMSPVDLFIAVKYGDYTSIFQFEVVEPGQFGYLSSDYATILANTADGAETALNYDGFNDVMTGNHNTCSIGVSNFSSACMPYNSHGNNPLGVSHVVGYWPPVDLIPPPPEVPAPATAALLLGGLGGLGWLARRRKAA